MIDLHCHILPGMDDGSPDLATSLVMARMAVDDGIGTIACTPHILPGVYNNSAEAIAGGVATLAAALERSAIPLELTIGADVHVAPNLLSEIRLGRVPTIGGSRYLLLEPPHHVLPPRLEEFTFALAAAGIVSVLTHPERLAWIESHYDIIRSLAAHGVMMQITAGSVIGSFGSRARYWADRMLSEGIVDVMSTDAHDTARRPPQMARARDAVAQQYGEETATRLVATNPLHMLENMLASELRRTSA